MHAATLTICWGEYKGEQTKLSCGSIRIFGIEKSERNSCGMRSNSRRLEGLPFGGIQLLTTTANYPKLLQSHALWTPDPEAGGSNPPRHTNVNPVIVRLHRISLPWLILPVCPICAPDEPKDPEISQRILNETKVLEKRLARENQRNTKLLKTILTYTKVLQMTRTIEIRRL